MSFSSHFRNLVFVVIGNEVTKILHDSLITFFTDRLVLFFNSPLLNKYHHEGRMKLSILLSH